MAKRKVGDRYLDRSFQRSEGVALVKSLNGEQIVVCTKRGKILTISGFASELLPVMNAGIKVRQLIEILAPQKVDDSEFMEEARTFVRWLLEEKLFRIAKQRG